MYHKLVIVGHLGRDPELRYTPLGSPVCNFNMATNRKRKDADDVVVWFRVAVWGSQAEACNQYLSRGRLVLVEGELTPDTDGSPRTWTRSDGHCGAAYEVRANVVKFLGGRQDALDDDDGAVEVGQAELPF